MRTVTRNHIGTVAAVSLILVMSGAVLAGADQRISTTIVMGPFELADTGHGLEILVECFGCLLVPG